MILDSTSLVWTPDHSGYAREGLGTNLAQKCLKRWDAAVGVDEGENVTLANQRLSYIYDRKLIYGRT